MASDCAALGTFSRFLVEPGLAPHTFDASSERYPILYERFGTNRKLQGRRQITGTRSLWTRARRPKTYVPIGAIAMQPGPADLVNWLPRILGGTFSGTSITTGEELPRFGVLLDRENEIFQYENCMVAQAVFTAGTYVDSPEEEFVEMILVIAAETELEAQAWPGTEPALPNSAAYVPYGIWEGVLVAGGLAAKFDRFNLQIDNQLTIKNRNSLTPNCIRSSGRSVRLQTINPFISDTIDKSYSLWTTGAAGTLTFTNGTLSTAFTFPDLRNEFETPTVQSKGEIPLTLNLEAARTTGLPEITVVNDSTP